MNPKEKLSRRPLMPETMTTPGMGVDRRTLLAGESTRTRVLTRREDGSTGIFIVAGGNGLNDGHTPGERPPLVINEGVLNETHGAQGVAVLPYGADTLRDSDGVYVGEDFTLGSAEQSRSLGKVFQIDHIPSNDGRPVSEPTPDELPLSSVFEPHEKTIQDVARLYQSAQNGVAPPSILP